MVRNATFGLNLVVLSKKSEFFIKWTHFFFIKSAENGSFFINMNIGINGRIYTPVEMIAFFPTCQDQLLNEVDKLERHVLALGSRLRQVKLEFDPKLQ